MISIRNFKQKVAALVQRSGHGEPPVVHVTRSTDGRRSSVSLRGQNINGDVSIRMHNGDVDVQGAGIVVGFDLSDEGMERYHNERWDSLPQDVQQRMIDTLRAHLTRKDMDKVRELHRLNPKKWWSAYHHGAGTAARNALRQSGIHDADLLGYYPEGWGGYYGLDDFWVRAVEEAVGVHR